MRWIVLCLMALFSYSIFALEATVLNESTARGFIPLHMIDHSGFAVAPQDSLVLEGESFPIVPAFPIYKQKFSNQKFIGLKVPRKYLTDPQGPSFQTAEYVLKHQLRDPKGRPMTVVPYEGELYAFLPGLSVAYGRSRTVGLSLSFGRGYDVVLGDEFTLGWNLRVGPTSLRVGEEEGLNLGQPLRDLFEGLDIVATRDTVEDLVEIGYKFTPYLQAALRQNAEAVNWEDPLPSARAGYHQPSPNRNYQLKQSPSLSAFSEELNESFKELRSHLEKEVKWQSKVEPAVSSTLIWDNTEANELIQALCDHVAAGYQVPKKIWPRCRVAASLSPNAWAFGGGDIFVSAGLIGLLQSVDAMMLVIAHEVGHVVARHTSQLLPKAKALQYAAAGAGIASSLFSIGAGYGSLGNVTWLTYLPQTVSAQQATGLANKLMLKTGVAGLMAYSRTYEWQADRFGHQVALATGANQEKMRAGFADFKAFIERFAPRGTDFLDQMFASHPPWEEREEEVGHRIATFSTEILQSGQENQLLKQSYVARYERLHKLLRPRVEMYGRGIRSLRQGQNNSLYQQHFVSSFFLPGGRCVVHALSRAAR